MSRIKYIHTPIAVPPRRRRDVSSRPLSAAPSTIHFTAILIGTTTIKTNFHVPLLARLSLSGAYYTRRRTRDVAAPTRIDIKLVFILVSIKRLQARISATGRCIISTVSYFCAPKMKQNVLDRTSMRRKREREINCKKCG